MYPRILENRIALVTGGGSGIGREAARAYANAGATVVVCGRRANACEETVALLRRDDPQCTAAAHRVDVTDASDVARLFEIILSDYGRLDAAFLNAGIGIAGTITDQPLEAFERVMRTNCTGLWLCMKQALRIMLSQGSGAIVNNLSVHAKRTIFPGTAAYTASKHAALGLTKMAAIESAEHGVRVNGVAPGPILTDMLKASVEVSGGVEGWASMTPQGRVGEPRELAQAVLWLSSDLSSYVNGAVLNVDGAFLAG